MVNIIKNIKLKETNQLIRENNREKNIQHFEKKNTIQVKKQKEHNDNSNDEKTVTPRQQAVRKVERAEKITAAETIHKQKKVISIAKDKLNDINIVKDKKSIKVRPSNSIKNNKVNIKNFNMNHSKNLIPSIETKEINNADQYISNMRMLSLNKYKKRIRNNSNQMNKISKKATSVNKVLKNTFHAVKKTATSISNLASIGTGFLLMITISLFIGVFACLSQDGGYISSTELLSTEVLQYQSTIEDYAQKYEIEEYVSLIMAVMMQESEGKGNDVMQSSEFEYNTEYPRIPDGITDIKYSIECGVHYLADCLKESKVENSSDMKKISLALQGYDYGKGYIAWAIQHFGGYTKANAKVYSDQKKSELNISEYGNPNYVEIVLRYYHIGNQGIVAVAKSQVGNIGGQPYWSWYGFEHHVEWCACFVSWCANESGDLNVTIPKFSRVEDGIQWFKDKEKWKNGNYIPKSGDLIFFDWNQDNDSDHVGIVERTDNNYIYTIEGNSKDECKQKRYTLNNKFIYGYGLNNNLL